ncbi:hypothetical protein Goarm_010334 [Gossypium armourianum]|uniref:Uncharacterized protein n=1 Tax=Gossypium armourianum TaxID=34283 RepID=A0A7J9JVQ0_9ROSI|nr:hypothetical protein [Gossypium armourianum]
MMQILLASSVLFTTYSEDLIELILTMIWSLWMSRKVISFIHSHLRDLTALDVTVGATMGSRAESWHLAIEPLLYSKTEDRSEISALIKEGQHCLLTGFIDLSIKHCYKEQNTIARLLVSLGFRLAYGQFSVERVPSEIESVVATNKWWVDPPD